MAYGFVKQSGGHIRLYSEIGEGTTVRIYLPRSTGVAVDTRPAPPDRLKHGNEAILVVEDDLKVQSTVVELLSGLGYAVLRANNADQALAIVASGVHIDLLFTDVVMPGVLRSPEMARRAVRILPRLKVLFTSGYTQNAIVHGGRLDPGVELLSKPYSREQLASKVRQVLGNSDALAGQSGPGGARPGDAHVSAGDGDGLHILVVDDDVASLDATCELLMLIGMGPHPAASAAQALNTLDRNDFDVLFTDVVMPDMSGTELARRASAIRPELRITFASGRAVPENEALGFEWSALRKPFTIEQLRVALVPADRPQASRRADEG